MALFPDNPDMSFAGIVTPDLGLFPKGQKIA
jgi:hypothetical protein